MAAEKEAKKVEVSEEEVVVEEASILESLRRVLLASIGVVALTIEEMGELVGEVLYIDDFGNIISNISAEALELYGVHEGDSLIVTLGSKKLNMPFCSAYGEVPVGTILALIGSSNFLEVAVNQGIASKILEADVGDLFCVSVVDSS